VHVIRRAIVCVVHNPFLAEWLSWVLRREGCIAALATSREAAVALVDELRAQPDVSVDMVFIQVDASDVERNASAALNRLVTRICEPRGAAALRRQVSRTLSLSSLAMPTPQTAGGDAATAAQRVTDSPVRDATISPSPMLPSPSDRRWPAVVALSMARLIDVDDAVPYTFDRVVTVPVRYERVIHVLRTMTQSRFITKLAVVASLEASRIASAKASRIAASFAHIPGLPAATSMSTEAVNSSNGNSTMISLARRGSLSGAAPSSLPLAPMKSPARLHHRASTPLGSVRGGRGGGGVGSASRSPITRSSSAVRASTRGTSLADALEHVAHEVSEATTSSNDSMGLDAAPAEVGSGAPIFSPLPDARSTPTRMYSLGSSASSTSNLVANSSAFAAASPSAAASASASASTSVSASATASTSTSTSTSAPSFVWPTHSTGGSSSSNSIVASTELLGESPAPEDFGDAVARRARDLHEEMSTIGRASDELRIMVVDDNRVNIRVICKMLGELGFRRVLEAKNGVEALRSLKATVVDLVITDLQMPEMDGIELCRELRALPVPEMRASMPGWRQPYVVGSSTSIDNDIYAQCMRAGMNHTLAKPVRIASLTSMLYEVASSFSSWDGDPDGTAAATSALEAVALTM
jgi:CheY-like chemotaxis protein